MSLEKATVLITGASRGLGRTLAQTFSEHGSRLALMSRTQEELQQAAQDLGPAGDSCIIWPGDVTNQDDLNGFVQAAIERFGTIDILINNAAIIGPPQFLGSQDQPDWSKTVDIDLKAPAELCRAALPHMQAQKNGVVINVSSGLARMAFPRFNAYCVAKAGLEQMTRCLSEEYSDSGISFYAVDPGVMDTSMQSEIRAFPENEISPELKRQFQQMKEEGHLRSPQKTAELVIALAQHRPQAMSGRTASIKDLPRIVGN